MSNSLFKDRSSDTNFNLYMVIMFICLLLFVSHQLYKIYEIGLLYILLLLLQFVNRGFTYLLTISLNHPAQLNVGLLQ